MRATSNLSGSEGFKVVFFDLPEHYAAVTSTLLERQFVHDVFFTRQDEGYVDDKARYKELGHVQAFFLGGCYVGVCVNHSIKDITEHVPAPRRLLIPDLTLPHPYNPRIQVRRKIPDGLVNLNVIRNDEKWLQRLERTLKQVDGVSTLEQVLS